MSVGCFSGGIRGVGLSGDRMSRTTTNALLDALAGFLFAAMLATGFVLQFVLPPGSGKTWILWSLERHDWAHMHSIVSGVLLVVLAAHVALHWKWVVEVLGRRLGGRRMSGKSLAGVTLGTSAFLAVGFGVATFTTREPRRDLSECALAESTPASPAPGAAGVSYARDVAPVLAKKCVSCHHAGRARSGVRLDGYGQVLGHVVRGAPQKSLIVRALDPPLDETHRIDAATLDLLKRWIAEGAPE